MMPHREDARPRRLTWIMLASALLASPLLAADYTLRPTRASGVEGLDWILGPGDREITLRERNQSVEIQVFISGFGDQGVAAYQGGLDCDDLTLLELTARDQECTINDPPDTFCMNIDRDQPTWILAAAPAVLGSCVNVELCPGDVPGDYACGSVAISEDSGPDQGIEYYAMQFTFEVGPNASGNYDVGLSNDPNWTFLRDADAEVIPIDAVNLATIRVPAGACCIPTVGCQEDATPNECQALGGQLFEGQSCVGIDDDADGINNLCDICPGGDDRVDDDSDSIPDDCDPCPGVNNNDEPDCVNVPTVSTWGLLALALSLLVLAKVTKRQLA